MPELAIIPADLWQRIQQRVGARKAPGSPRQPRTSTSFALSGLLRCGVCGGGFGIVGQAKRAGRVWRTLGCSAHNDHRCTNAKTISERKVVTALTDYLRARLSRPDRLEAFVETFRKRWEQLEAEGSPTRELETKIERQRGAVDKAFTMLEAAPSSKLVGDKLAAEERTLASWRRSSRPRARRARASSPTLPRSRGTSASWPRRWRARSRAKLAPC